MIPVSKPSITDKEKLYVADAMASGWVSSKGPYIPKFEEAWAKWNDYKYGVACSSGTNALLLALRALGIKEGDEVIVPDFTMIATAWAVTYCGATPVFVDCKDDLTINPDLIEAKITKNTKAIMPVHIYGRQCDMDKIMKIAYEYNLRVVEDSAEAHGVKPRGDIACFSFFGNKIITTGEGGMCLTNDPHFKEQMEHLRSMAFDTEHTFLHKKVGYNFRMTNLQAAIGLAQVERIEEIINKRKLIEKWYDERLPEQIKMPKRNVLWMYDIKLKNRDEVKQKLAEAGIETRYFFKPMTDQPMYKEQYIDIKGTDTGIGGFYAEFHKAYLKSRKGIYLPTFHDITESEVDYICTTIKNNL